MESIISWKVVQVSGQRVTCMRSFTWNSFRFEQWIPHRTLYISGIGMRTTVNWSVRRNIRKEYLKRNNSVSKGRARRRQIWSRMLIGRRSRSSVCFVIRKGAHTNINAFSMKKGIIEGFADRAGPLCDQQHLGQELLLVTNEWLWEREG